MKTYKYTEVSTGHITDNDDRLLTKSSDIATIVVYPYDFGYFIPIYEEIDFDELGEFSSAFLNLIKKCQAEGITLLKLDADAPVDSSLQLFDW